VLDGGATPGPDQLAYGAQTPDARALAAATAAQAGQPLTPEQYNAMRWEREVEARSIHWFPYNRDGVVNADP
jgi:splicing factor 3B subunit 1